MDFSDLTLQSCKNILSNLSDLEKKAIALVSYKIVNTGKPRSTELFLYHCNYLDIIGFDSLMDMTDTLKMGKDWIEWVSIIKNLSSDKKNAFAFMMSEMIKKDEPVDVKKKEIFLLTCGIAGIILPKTEYFNLS